MPRRRLSRKLLLFPAVLLAIYAATIYTLALLSNEKLIGKNCLPDNLKYRAHDDYLLGKRIPRSTTSACFTEPPLKLLGNQRSASTARSGEFGPSSLPGPGEWQFSAVREKSGWPVYLPYFAVTTRNCWHFRIGARWDENDHYYSFPSIAFKKIRR